MTKTDEERRDEAVEWFIRLRDFDDETIWPAYLAWLEADPRNAAAFSDVEAFWVELDDIDRGAVEKASVDRDERDGQVQAEVISLDERRRTRARWHSFWVPGAAAAAAAAAAVFTFVLPQSGPAPGVTAHSYRTGPDQIREVVLADGSRLTLNRNTEVTVLLASGRRQAELKAGEVAFDIRHEQDRPFAVNAADRQIRVLGTEFNVIKQDGAFEVTVRRGRVAVSNADDPSAHTDLPAGRSLVRLRGAKEDTVSDVAPDDAFAWQSGNLVYADRPITEVATDLSRYLGVPVDVAPDLGQVRVTGVLKIGSKASLRRQVEALLPVRFTDAPGDRKRIMLVSQH